MTPLVLDAFPTDLEYSVPLYLADGSLAPGDFLPPRLEFETRFVHSGDVLRRTAIYAGWNTHRQALMNAGVSATGWQLLNGSFTTEKQSPGDIDIAVEVAITSDALRTLRPTDAIVRLLGGPAAKVPYMCDAYPIYSLPRTDPLYETVTQPAIEYWSKWFGRTRRGTQKGRIWAKTGGL